MRFLLRSAHLQQSLTAIDAERTLRTAHPRVGFLRAGVRADVAVHDDAAIRAEPHGHDGASVVVVGATSLLHLQVSWGRRALAAPFAVDRSGNDAFSASFSPSRTSDQKRARVGRAEFPMRVLRR
jgi:hypothetical protein